MEGFGTNLFVAVIAQILVAIGIFIAKFTIKKIEEFSNLPFVAKDRLSFIASMWLTGVAQALFIVFIIRENYVLGVLTYIAWIFFLDKTADIFYKYYYAALKGFEREEAENAQSNKDGNAE